MKSPGGAVEEYAGAGDVESFNHPSGSGDVPRGVRRLMALKSPSTFAL